MRIINHTYSDNLVLKEFIKENQIQDSNKIFIQMFYSESVSEKNVLEVRENLLKNLPNSMLMGTSSGGNVVNGHIEDDSIILSFSIFENSYANTFSFKNISVYEIIEKFKNEIIKKDTKLLVLFANIFTFNVNTLINELNEHLPDVVICGGYAGINFETKESLIFSQDSLNDELVVTSINSDCLKVSTNYLLNWQAIGKEMIVTKSDKNILYEIDNKKAIDIYNHYLGEDVVKGFPKSGLDFPLLFEENGTKSARVPISLREDGSVELSGNILEGEIIRFSFANIDHMENEKHLLKEREHNIAEATYIYSCVARKKIFEEYLNDELGLINQIATTAGFMTYGEFFHNCESNKNTLLNTSTTYITLSEEEHEKIDFDKIEFSYGEKNKDLLALKVLSHLVDRTSKDLEISTLELKRTNEELEDSNEELQTMIYSLKTTQDKLIESEKMASLGSLVAGVAHEINTPVGIGLTGITHFIEESSKLAKDYKDGNMTEEAFNSFLTATDELSQLIKKNLERTAHLVKSFKQVAVDQTNDVEREIDLKEYIFETLLSLHSVTRQTKLNIELICDDTLRIKTFPGSISQIITNLVMNSINHGFNENEKGSITISVSQENEKIILNYKDSGKGVKKENLNRIFDPFFTTNRENGGTGLGLNILYNIVTNTLNGTIECKSEENNGVEFIIIFEVKKTE